MYVDVDVDVVVVSKWVGMFVIIYMYLVQFFCH